VPLSLGHHLLALEIEFRILAGEPDLDGVIHPEPEEGIPVGNGGGKD